jgi:uncharacterized protein (TIGR02145 family)
MTAEDKNIFGIIAVAIIAFLLWRLISKTKPAVLDTEPVTTAPEADPNCQYIVSKPLSSYGPYPSNLLGKGWCYKGDGTFFDNKGQKVVYGDPYVEQQAANYSEAKQTESIRGINQKLIMFRLINSTPVKTATKVLDTTQDSTPFDPTPQITDIDGNVYTSVIIGTQEWLVENLKTTKYNDGTAIPNITDDTLWALDIAGAMCWYDNDISNNTPYGVLYNWYAVNTGKLAPAGWRVPSQIDMETLGTFINDGVDGGGKLKEVGLEHWASPNTGAIDTFGFKGLPAGLRFNSGAFSLKTADMFLYSSTQVSASAGYSRALTYNNAQLSITGPSKNYGHSVRCMRDI